MTGSWRQRAVMLRRAGRRAEVSLIEQPIEGPGPGSVLFAPEILGLCSSDFHIWAGRKRAASGILGHEGGGRVLELGEGVDGWKLGDFAVVNPLLSCRTCASCADGQDHICPHREIVGYNGRGLMADLVTLEARALFRPPENLSESDAAFVEPLACVIHAQSKLPAAPRSSMAILGAGPMGVLHASWAKLSGWESVWLIDCNEKRLAMARACGAPADLFIAIGQGVDDARIIRQRTGVRGAEVTVVANSTRAGHELAGELCLDGGAVLAFASILDAPGDIFIKGCITDSDRIHREEGKVLVSGPDGDVWVYGAIGFDPVSFRTAAEAVSGRLDCLRFVTAEVDLDDVPGLIAGRWQEHLKILVRPTRGGNGNG